MNTVTSAKRTRMMEWKIFYPLKALRRETILEFYLHFHHSYNLSVYLYDVTPIQMKSNSLPIKIGILTKYRSVKWRSPETSYFAFRLFSLIVKKLF